MIPGYGSTRLKEEVVASAASITVKGDMVRITGTTGVNNIFSPLMVGRDSNLIFVYTPDAGVALGTTGNIAVGQTLATNRLYALVFSHIAGKWLIHGVA